MTIPEPNIQIPVDLTNPGQFFACCGLLELADRLWPGTEVVAWFEPKHFCISSVDPACSTRELMKRLHSCEVVQLDKDDDSASPLLMCTSNNLRLDWWTKIETDSKKIVDIGTSKTLMTWSGSQKGPRIFRLFQESLAQLDAEDPLNHAIAVCDPFASNPDRAVSPFYFDSRRDGNSQDIGFSPDEQSMSVIAFPAVEILALVGIQRFRPAIHEDTKPRSFVYTAWTERLSPIIAAVAAQGAMPTRSNVCFRFTKPSRGGEYLSMFSRVKLERSNHD